MATATRTGSTGKANDAPQWARMVKARNKGCFIDAPAWETVFDADLRDWSGPEIEQAAAWMQGEGQDWPSVTCATDLVKAVRTMRKRARGEGTHAADRAASCGQCNRGLIETWRGWRPSWKLADYTRATTGVIPCNCEAGLYAATTCQPWKDKPVHDREALRACAADAKRARAAYNTLAQGMICAPAFTRVAPAEGS